MQDREVELDTVRKDAETIAYVLRHTASLSAAERGPMRDLTHRLVEQTAQRMILGVPACEARQLAVIRPRLTGVSSAGPADHR